MCRVKSVTPRFSSIFTCRQCEGNENGKNEENGEAVEQEEKLCDDVETVQEFTYLGDRVSNVNLSLISRITCAVHLSASYMKTIN